MALSKFNLNRLRNLKLILLRRGDVEWKSSGCYCPLQKSRRRVFFLLVTYSKMITSHSFPSCLPSLFTQAQASSPRDQHGNHLLVQNGHYILTQFLITQPRRLIAYVKTTLTTQVMQKERKPSDLKIKEFNGHTERESVCLALMQVKKTKYKYSPLSLYHLHVLR